MKIAPNVIFLFKDSDGLATVIADALQPNPISAFQRLNESFDLPLDRYGISDSKACGKLIHFVDDGGNYQVSLMLLEKYEPPNLVCAVHEVLSQILQTSIGLPSLVLPFAGTISQLKWDTKSMGVVGKKAELYGVHVGPETDTMVSITSRLAKLPSSLQIHCEYVACFLQLVQALNLPTSVLICHRESVGEELQILYNIGELLATTFGLSFMKDKIKWNPVKTSRDNEQPWRTLYG
ncbi:hypothetical protein K2173_018319 [Erythroxylum novogranatense]|uniref:DUF7894 domain-containing protein n=1 Tax=Erythroxylum novogranatense TaxID=1862640 RepID=A0AAV8UA94_9ROSI|nr:hypothetical protein K2173_018319 [Erythroxylum novogranatense]